MKTQDILTEVLSLPAEQRVIVAENLLKSLNAPQKNNDKAWISLAEKRLKEVNEKKVSLIAGEDVFKRIWNNSI